MPMLSCTVSALAVASLYYLWRGYFLTRQQSERLLRERVAHLLWTLAQGTP